jgi:hypothetical protein
MEIEYRRFEPSDEPGCDWPVIGMTAVLDGEILGYGGIQQYKDGRWWGVLDVNDERGRIPTMIHRFAVGILKAAMEAGITVYVLCDTAHPRAVPWMERLGFVPVPKEQKDYWIRRMESYGSGKNRAYMKPKDGAS